MQQLLVTDSIRTNSLHAPTWKMNSITSSSGIKRSITQSFHIYVLLVFERQSAPIIQVYLVLNKTNLRWDINYNITYQSQCKRIEKKTFEKKVTRKITCSK